MSEKSILFVEDNPDDIAMTLRALKSCGVPHRVVVAENGEQALDFLFRKGKYLDDPTANMPDLVLLDLNLPGTNGLEVLGSIRDNPSTSFLPVVILSGSAEEKDLVASYHLNCNSYLFKSNNFEEFRESIHLVGTYWLTLNETPCLI